MRFTAPLDVEVQPDPEHPRTSPDILQQAARNLYFRLHPAGLLSEEAIVQNITAWAFQVMPHAEEPNREAVESERSDLSLVETEPRDSFLALCENENESGNSTDGSDNESTEEETSNDEIGEESN